MTISTARSPCFPGTSGGDFSARFAVRGGLYDETLVTLDDQELMEPFHLKDFQGVFSILDPEAIGGVELTPGGFTAKYGDRMTGVLDMVTRSPKADPGRNWDQPDHGVGKRRWAFLRWQGELVGLGPARIPGFHPQGRQ